MNVCKYCGMSIVNLKLDPMPNNVWFHCSSSRYEDEETIRKCIMGQYPEPVEDGILPIQEERPKNWNKWVAVHLCLACNRVLSGNEKCNCFSILEMMYSSPPYTLPAIGEKHYK